MAKTWTTRHARKKPTVKTRRRRYMVIERYKAEQYADGSRLPRRRTVRKGRGGIVQAVINFVTGKPGHAGRSRRSSWW